MNTQPAKRSYAPLTPDDRFRFGKHKGKEVWLVIDIDPEYITWCIENVDGFELDNEAYELYQKAISK